MDFDDILDLDTDISPQPPPPSSAAPRPMKFLPRGAKLPVVVPKPEPPQAPPPSQPVSVKIEKDDSRNHRDPSVLQLTDEMDSDEMPKEEEVTAAVPMEVEVEEEEVEEEDSVVCEFDVIFNKPAPESKVKVYVLQYPLRPSWRPYELEERCTEVRVKEKSAEVQVDLMIDTSSEYYDPEAPSAMAMEKQMLASSWSPLQRSCYSVGILEGRKLYLNPVHAVVQLRPSMEYLNSTGKSRRSIQENSAKAEEPSGEASGRNSRKQQKQPDQEVSEPWISLKYHGPSSFESAIQLDKMLEETKSPISFSINPVHFMDSLCPGVSSKLEGNLTLRAYLAMPLEERFKKFLTVGPQVCRFADLRLLAPDQTDEAILSILQKFSVLVQGLWVPKSSLRLPGVSGPDHGVRDYVLYQFSKDKIFREEQMPKILKAKELAVKWLRVFADQMPSYSDWKFREAEDQSFLKSYPDTVIEQKEDWEKRGKILSEKLLEPKSRPHPTNPLKTERPVANQSPATHGDKRGATALNGESSGKIAISDEAVRRLLRKPLETHKVCSFQTICQGLRDIAVSMNNNPKADHRAVRAAAAVAEAPREEFEAAISEVAVKVHDLYVLKSSSDNAELNPLRGIVIDLLIGKGRNAKLKKAEVVEAAKIGLKMEPTSNDFQKVITEFCVFDRGSWVLKSGDGAPK